MALFSCNVIIEGYWREINRQFIPNYTGIFFVYLANYDDKQDIIIPLKLIFIGQGLKIREEIQHYILTENPWDRFKELGYEFCFSATYLSELEMERVLSAFIYQFKPPANNQYIDFFTYDPTTITVTGKTALLKSHFTVQNIDL